MRHVVQQHLFSFYCIVVFIVLSSCANTAKEDRPPDEDAAVIIDYAKLVPGDTVYPFNYLDLNKRDWRVVIRISGDDLHDVSHRYSTRMFYTTEKVLLRKIKKWKFIYRKQGVSNASSTFRVFHDHDLIESYGIVLEKNMMGLQSKKYGLFQAADRNQFLEFIKEMD